MLKRNKSVAIICSIMIGVVFVLAMLVIMTVAGVIRLGQNTLVIETESFEAKYDGTPITNYTWKIAEGKLKKGHTIDVKFTGSQTNIGESDNTVEVIITDELGTDVTSDYKIQYKYGLLKVNPRTVAVYTLSASKAFDGIPLVKLEYGVDEEFDGLVKGHLVKAAVTGYQLEVGESPNKMSEIEIFDLTGADVTGNYRIIVREGTLLVYDEEGMGGGSGGGSGSGEGGSGSGEGEGEGEGEGGSGGGEGEGEGGSGGGSGNAGGLGDLGGGDLGGGGGSAQAVLLYQVYAEKTANIYLKQASFGDYNGKGFVTADTYDKLIYDQLSAMYLTSYALEGNAAAQYRLKIKVFLDTYVLPYYLSPTRDVHTLQTSDVYSIGETGGIEGEYTVSYLEGGNVFAAIPTNLRGFEELYREYVYQNYLKIDTETFDYMSGLIKENGLDKGTDTFATIQAVAAYIKNSASYNLEYDTALDAESNIAVAFLETYKEGVCRHYAAAATLMFRTMNIPARYTVGVLAEAEAGEWTDVMSSNAHAWVEVYVNGMGWVMVEVTGGNGGGSGGGNGGGSGGSGGGGDGGGGGGGSQDEQKPELEITPVTVSKKYNGTTTYKATNKVTSKQLEELIELGYTYEVVVEGSRKELGISESTIVSFKLFKDGKDVTDEFDITYKKGKIHVYYSVLSFESHGDSKTYGEEVTKKVDKLFNEATALMPGHTIKITMTATYNAGKSLNTYKVEILDGNTDVTDWYKIDRAYGTLDIKHKEITITAKSATKTYDGSALTCNEIEYDELLLVKGHYIESYTVEGSQTSHGRSSNVVTDIKICDADGKDVTGNYEIKLVEGMLKVTKT